MLLLFPKDGHFIPTAFGCPRFGCSPRSEPTSSKLVACPVIPPQSAPSGLPSVPSPTLQPLHVGRNGRATAKVLSLTRSLLYLIWSIMTVKLGP